MSEKIFIRAVTARAWRALWRQALQYSAPRHTAHLQVDDSDAPKTVTYHGADGWDAGFYHCRITYSQKRQLLTLERGTDPRACDLVDSYNFLHDLILVSALPASVLSNDIA